MKKRVRLYKAQEGGMPDANMLGYPGAQAQQSDEEINNQLVSMILTDIGNSLSKDQIVAKLVTIYDQDPNEANQIVDQVYKYVEQQKQSEVDAADSEDDEEEDVIETAIADEEIAEEPETAKQTGTQMSNEIIDEWDDSSDDDSQLASDIIMRYGGYPMAQDGMEVPIQMPDVSAYLPQDMGDYLGGSTNPYSGLAWQEPEMMENVSEDEEVFSDYAEPILPEERFGGMPSKRSYVNSVLKLVKKQMGGDSATPESAKYNDDNADPTGANVRKKSLDKFIGSVKNQSNMALAKQQAEQQYEQMMQQQQMMQQYPMAQEGGEQDTENPMHHLALFSQAAGDVFQDDQNELVEAQFGGLFGRRRMNNMMQQGMPMIPGMPPITKIDVRKSGWLFNRPKEYSIEFGAFSPMPGMSMPGLPAGAYGYTTKIIKTPATRRKVEATAEVVNKEALKEVSTATPTSEATTKVADSPVTTTETVPTSTGTKNIPVKVNPKVVDKIKTDNKVDSKNTKDGIYAYGNSDGMYKKQNGIWYVNRGVKTNMQYVPIREQKRINELNKKADYKGAASKSAQGKSTWQPPTMYNPAIDPITGNYRPMSAIADDDFVQSAAFLGAAGRVGSGAADALEQFTFKRPTNLLGKGRNMVNPGQPMLGPGQPMLNPGQGLINPPGGFQYSLPFQEGGIVNDPFADEYGNLQQFISGGDEDFTQGDLDDVYSKDTANGDFPMAQWGGGIQALFPANILPRRYGRGYSQMRGVPYDPRTKMPMLNFMPGPGARLNKIDVTKSNWLTGAPKKYTVTYGQTMIGPSNKPGLPNSGTTTPQTQMRNSKRTDIPNDLSLAARMAINRGDRQTARNDRRLARHPEYAGSIFTPEQQEARKAFKQATNPKGPVEPGMTMDQLQQFNQVVGNPSGVPNYNGEFERGGDLRRFLPQAQVGQQSPVTYANNPAVANVTQAYFDKNNQAKKGDFTDIFADYAAANNKDASGGYEQETAVDYKAKKAPGSFDGEAMVNTINAGVQGVTGLINRAETQAAEAKMQDNLTADNLYASDPSKDRGDYDTNSGLYRQDEMGQKWNSRSKQYGGNIYQEGGQKPRFYDTAIGEYNQWLSTPAAWQEDPEMLAPDGKNLNLCLDCMDVNWDSEDDIKDAHKLIEEGYSTGTHRNQEVFNAALQKYGLSTPQYASKKVLSKNQFGGNAGYSEGDEVDMTEEELADFMANGGEVEYL
jgi:hypothetical protein